MSQMAYAVPPGHPICSVKGKVPSEPYSLQKRLPSRLAVNPVKGSTPSMGPAFTPPPFGQHGHAFCQAAPTHRPIFWPSPGYRPP